MSLSRTIKGIKRAETLLVTPRIEEFLRKHPDGVIWDEEGYALWRSLTERAATNDVRHGRFGASSRGMCHRRQVFTFLGMPEGKLLDPEVQNLFNDGKWRHLRWQMMGIQSGALTHAEYPYGIKKYRLSGKADGLNSYESFGFELKGDRNWSRALDGVPEAHNLQIHTMLLAMGWDKFSYVIESKSSQEWREIIVHRDEAVIRLVRQELEELNEYVEDRKLPDVLPACASKEGPYRSCPFAQQCLGRDRMGNDWPSDRDWES